MVAAVLVFAVLTAATSCGRAAGFPAAQPDDPSQCQRALTRSQSNRTVPYQASAQPAPQGGRTLNSKLSGAGDGKETGHG